MAPIEYVKGKARYRHMISSSIKELDEKLFYSSLDTPDDEDMVDVSELPVESVWLFDEVLADRIQKPLRIQGDFAYEQEQPSEVATEVE